MEPILTRRSLLLSAAAMPFMGLANFGQPKSAVLIRYGAHTPEGKAMLDIYAMAVDRMMRRPPSDPLSWEFQWYTHAVPSPGKDQKLKDVFSGAGPALPIATAVWATCKPHFGGPTDYFLPWHRIFLAYFERIIREVSGRPEFTLPYWDYANASQPDASALPEAFRLPADITNPLYRSERLINDGSAIDPADLALDLKNAYAQTVYSPTFRADGFCNAVDGGIHGNIHVSVGTRANMGRVPTAAGDPIFWLHHCNIDRIWASWQAAGFASPVTPTVPFTFADEKGNSVTRTIGEFVNLAQLDYQYQRLDSLPSAPPPNLLLQSEAPRLQIMAQGIRNEILLKPSEVVVKLKPLGDDSGAFLNALRQENARRLILIIENLELQGDPEATYGIYVNLRASASMEERRARKVGNINFFGVASDGRMHSHGDWAGRAYSFDITAVTREALETAESLQVSIIPNGRANPDARPIIGSIRLLRA